MVFLPLISALFVLVGSALAQSQTDGKIPGTVEISNGKPPIILPALVTRADRSGGKGKWNSRGSSRHRAPPTPVIISSGGTSNELPESEKGMSSGEMAADQSPHADDYGGGSNSLTADEEISIDRQGRPHSGSGSGGSLAERLMASGISTPGGTYSMHDGLTINTRGPPILPGPYPPSGSYPPPSGSTPGGWVQPPSQGSAPGGWVPPSQGWNAPQQPSFGWGSGGPPPAMGGWGGPYNAKVICYQCTVNT